MKGGPDFFFEERFRSFDESWSVTLEDIDLDGDLDATVLSGVYLNDGKGVFTQIQKFRYRHYTSTGFAWGDFNQDTLPDLWISQSSRLDPGFNDRIYFNQANGELDAKTISSPDHSMDVAVGDVDGDGDLDAWVATGLSNPDRLWLNDGQGRFTDSGQQLGHHESVAVELVDFDKDGDLDAWVANSRGPSFIYENDGHGKFDAQENAFRFGTNEGAQALVVTDINSDGFPDGIVVRNGFRGGPGVVATWVNLGNNEFRAYQIFSEGYIFGLGAGDFDGDGDSDLWVAKDGPDEIWMSDRFGRYFDIGLRVGDSRSMGVAIGDLDGDNDPDAIVASADGNSSVWINREFPEIQSIRNQNGFIEIRFKGRLYAGRSPKGRFFPVEGASSPYRVSSELSHQFFIAR